MSLQRSGVYDSCVARRLQSEYGLRLSSTKRFKAGLTALRKMFEPAAGSAIPDQRCNVSEICAGYITGAIRLEK